MLPALSTAADLGLGSGPVLSPIRKVGLSTSPLAGASSRGGGWLAGGGCACGCSGGGAGWAVRGGQYVTLPSGSLVPSDSSSVGRSPLSGLSGYWPIWGKRKAAGILLRGRPGGTQ